jgi:hypothetical protein
MSSDSLPAHEDQLKADSIIIKLPACDGERTDLPELRIPMSQVILPKRLSDALQQPAKPPKRRPPRKSGLYALLHAAQQHGITHPRDGFWTMLPKEFDAILALEHKAITQVVLEVLRQTVGRVSDGQEGRREWAVISQRHFARAGLMNSKAAQRGIKGALDKGYILRRRVGAQRFEYAIRWRGTN